MYEPEKRYPTSNGGFCGSLNYNIELVNQFYLVLKAGPVSPLHVYEFDYTIDFRFKDIHLPLNTIYHVQRFQYFLESFVQNLMIKNKVYYEDGIEYCQSYKDDIDSFNITFKLGSDENTLISLDKAQVYILSKELPGAIEQTLELYKTSLKEQIAHHNHSIMHIGPLEWH